MNNYLKQYNYLFIIYYSNMTPFIGYVNNTVIKRLSYILIRTSVLTNKL